MAKRLRTLGVVVAVIGLVFVIAGGVAYTRVQDGYGSLQAFSEAQNVTLSYNEDGQLIDRGTTEGADAIMSLLVDDWQYPVVESAFDANDPLVNTASEYMFHAAAAPASTSSATRAGGSASRRSRTCGRAGGSRSTRPSARSMVLSTTSATTSTASATRSRCTRNPCACRF